MSTLTIRLPDAKHERLKAFARTRGVSVNKLVEELATVALAQADSGWSRFGVDVFCAQSPHRAVKRNSSAVSLTVISHAALTGIPAVAATCRARRLLSGSRACNAPLSDIAQAGAVCRVREESGQTRQAVYRSLIPLTHGDQNAGSVNRPRVAFPLR